MNVLNHGLLKGLFLQKSVVYFVALILGCYGQDDFQGYNYPKPSCPLPLPVTETETATITKVFSTDATVYQTQILTNSVTVPVYFTSTVVRERLITSYSTVVSPVTQYQTDYRTVYITPSPVTLFNTVTATVQASCIATQDDSVANTYLPPDNSGQIASVDDYKQSVENTYLPPSPTGGDDSGNSGSGNVLNLGTGDTGSAFRRSVAGSSFNPFDTRRARYVLSLGALPPRF